MAREEAAEGDQAPPEGDEQQQQLTSIEESALAAAKSVPVGEKIDATEESVVPPPVRIHNTRSRTNSAANTPLTSPTAKSAQVDEKKAPESGKTDAESDVQASRRHNLRSRTATGGHDAESDAPKDSGSGSGESPAPRRSLRIRKSDNTQTMSAPATAAAQTAEAKEEDEDAEKKLDEVMSSMYFL